MSSTTEQLFEAAMLLPEDARVTLIERLLETMPGREIGLPIDSADFVAELDRRLADSDDRVAWTDLQAES